MPPDGAVRVDVEGRTLELSNLRKTLYPSGFTKGQVIEYYSAIAPCILPHLKDRPLTLKRYPHGTEREFFYEKRCPPFRPSWVKLSAATRKAEYKTVRYCVINDLPTLVWIANLASIELHVMLSQGRLDRPTMAVFDLDPGPGRSLADCAWAALEVRKILRGYKLESFPKVSGGKGVHLAVPFNTPAGFEGTKTFARAVAATLEREFPDRVTSNMRKDLRQGKIFVDWSQNSEHKTTVCVYSLRAKSDPAVAMPVAWEDLERAWKSKKTAPLVFSPDAALKRARRDGDLHAPVLTLKQSVPKI